MIPSILQLTVPVVLSPCLGKFSGAGLLSSSISIPWRQNSTMSSKGRFEVRPDSKIGASFASAPSAQFFHQLPEDLCIQRWQRGWQPLLIQIGCPIHPIRSHGCITCRCRTVGRENWNGWRKKPELHCPLAAQLLRQPPPKQPPEACGSSAGLGTYRKLACWGERTLTSLTRRNQHRQRASATLVTFCQRVSTRGWDDEKYAVVHLFT